MKIAMPKEGVMLNQHFGRSEEFVIVTIDGMDIVGLKEIPTQNLQHNHKGLSDMLAKEGVSLVIAAGMGEGAYNALKEKGIRAVRGASGSIKDIVQKYLDGELMYSLSANGHLGCHHQH